MIIVTGAAGFIGSNFVQALNRRGETDILAVDNMTRASKFHNLVDCEIADYLDKEALLGELERLPRPRAIVHQGACSDTMESDGRYMMRNNYRYSVALLEYAARERIPFIYASSAAVYGGSDRFEESRGCERPLNVYGYSKFLFDQIVRQRFDSLHSQVVGLRYFNVYGPRETHKERMASVAFHNFHQFRSAGRVKLFDGWDGWAAGQQSRDFIHVDDVVAVNLFFLDNPQRSGIFNLGTGRAQPFNDIATTVVNTMRRRDGHAPMEPPALVQAGLAEYGPFPDGRKGNDQRVQPDDIGLVRRNLATALL